MGADAKPNWCNPCRGYRPRVHECDGRRSAPAVTVDYDAVNIPVPPESADPRFVSGWRHGYEAAMRDQAERAVA